MKKLLILSGKGGTGKTTVAAAFIAFSEAKAFADCDVDAPNLHLVEKMTVEPESSPFIGSQKARIDPETCLGCGRCVESCRFGAIAVRGGRAAADEFACEGCGVCASVCPTGAASLGDDVAGELRLYGGDRVFSTAELRMGRGNSGKLVSAVKRAMQQAAINADLAIIDGSPGIGCPVIASVSGVDMALIVTEPTVSGMSDLKRLLKTTSVLDVKVAVCVNKFDVSPERAGYIEELCRGEGVAFVGRIPFDGMASAAANSGRSVAELDCPARDAIKSVYGRTMQILITNKE